MQRIAQLLERVDALTLREWIVAAGVLSLIAAIAWIGRNVGRLLDEVCALKERVRVAEGNLVNAEDFVARVDEALAKRMRIVEGRQDRLQILVENRGKSWRDSGQHTQDLKFTGPRTQIDLSKP